MALAAAPAGTFAGRDRRAPRRPAWLPWRGAFLRWRPAPAWATRMAAQIREQERQRFARDLHDSVGPLLAAVVMRTDAACWLAAIDPHAAAEALCELRDETRNAMAEVRRLAHAMCEPAAEGTSLGCALQTLGARFGQASGGRLTVRVDAPDGRPLPEAVTFAAYRIASEALTNVTKHAQARSADVSVRPEPGGKAIRLEIVDDGVGLASRPHSGLGLRSMRKRARELGGSCTVEDALPRGTKVCAILPAGPAARSANAPVPGAAPGRTASTHGGTTGELIRIPASREASLSGALSA